MVLKPQVTAKRLAYHIQQATDWKLHGDKKRAEEHLGYAKRFEDKLAEAGRCRRCGKVLTLPLSIQRGFGTSCWELVQ